MKEVIGLIAGSGRFPILFAKEARRQGLCVAAVALAGVTDPALKDEVDSWNSFKLGQVSEPLRVLKEAGAKKAVMAGKVQHVSLFGGIIPDLRAVRILAGLKDKRTDTLLGALASEFGKEGIELLSSATYLSHLIPAEGRLGRREPSKEERADIDLGWRAAKALAGFDIGQSVVVSEGAVVAVEGMEGTDALIERAGVLAGSQGRRPRLSVVKVAKPRQDFRFDLPVLGLDTLPVLEKAGVTALALEAGKTLVFDKEEFIRRADEKGIALMALSKEGGL